MVRKIIGNVLVILFIYFFMDFILRGVYQVFIRSESTITLNLPLIHVTKYLIIAIIIIMFIYRNAELTSAGKKILPISLVIAVLGSIVTSMWFNEVTEEKIIKFRVVWKADYSWEDIDHIETKIYREDRMARSGAGNAYRPLKVYKKYNIYLEDGNKINGWDNIRNVYNLHKDILEKEIDVMYNNKMDLVRFEQNYTSYFKKDMEKAKFVFYGIEEYNEEVEK